MIGWLNGGFGFGKSSVSAEVLGRRPDFMLFDPEEVGFMLRSSVNASSGDFQDLPVWRELVVETGARLLAHYQRPRAPAAIMVWTRSKVSWSMSASCAWVLE